MRRRFLQRFPCNLNRQYQAPDLNLADTVDTETKRINRQLADIQYRISALLRPFDLFLDKSLPTKMLVLRRFTTNFILLFLQLPTLLRLLPSYGWTICVVQTVLQLRQLALSVFIYQCFFCYFTVALGDEVEYSNNFTNSFCVNYCSVFVKKIFFLQN